MSDGRRPPAFPDRVVWIDGVLCRGREAVLSVFDRGARDGEGLFETLRTYAGRPFQWDRHLERLVVSAAELGFPVPAAPQSLRAAVDQVLQAAGLADAAVRMTVTRGVPSPGRGRRTRTGAWVEAEPIAARLWPARAGGARAVVSKTAFEPGPLGRHKTTSRLAYHLARDEARAARADEALLVSPAGLVLEGSVTNLFAVFGGTVATPALSLGILPGIARRTALELCGDLGIPVEERPIPRHELSVADELFLTNSIQEIVPIASLDGVSLRHRVIGERLSAAYRVAVGRELVTARGAPNSAGN